MNININFPSATLVPFIQEAKGELRSLNKQLHNLQNNFQQMRVEMNSQQQKLTEESMRIHSNKAQNSKMLRMALQKVVEQKQIIEENNLLTDINVKNQVEHLWVQESKSKLAGVNKNETQWSGEQVFFIPSFLKVAELQIDDDNFRDEDQDPKLMNKLAPIQKHDTFIISNVFNKDDGTLFDLPNKKLTAGSNAANKAQTP